MIKASIPSPQLKRKRTAQKQLQEWRKHILEIRNDVSWLVMGATNFNELFVSINNPKVRRKNIFFELYRFDYAQSVVLGICRQIDTDKRSQSLVNLLDSVFDNAEMVTKNYFIKQCTKGYSGNIKRIKSDNAARAFDEKFGRGNHIDPAKVYADKGDLLFQTKEIKKYRNKRVAHMDKKRIVKFAISFDDLLRAIKTIEEITIKYCYLLRAETFLNNTLKPISQSRWQNILKYPWRVSE